MGGPDGGNWVILKQKSRRDYIITTFTRESPTRGLFRLEGEEPLPEKLTVEDLNGWDGIFMHTSIPDAQGGGRRNVKLRRIRRLD